MSPRTAALLSLIVVAACDDRGPTIGDDDSATPGKDDRADLPTFVEIDATRPLSTSARALVDAAIGEIARVAEAGRTHRQKRLAAETVARLGAGDARIDTLDDARDLDLWHMCRDTSTRPGCDEDEPPPDGAFTGDAALWETLAAELDGYTWGNRLYFDLDDEALDPEALAATLVHELNHALNRSECWYYRNYWAHEVDETLAWLEEYRAFVAECVFSRGTAATAKRCDEVATHDLEAREYGLTPDLAALVDDPALGSVAIAEALLAEDGVYGWLVPAAEVWPDDFAECE